MTGLIWYWGIFSIILGISALLFVLNITIYGNSENLNVVSFIIFCICGFMLFIGFLSNPDFLKKESYYKPDEITRSKSLIYVSNDSLGEYNSGLKRIYDLPDSSICIFLIEGINFYNHSMTENFSIEKCKE